MTLIQDLRYAVRTLRRERGTDARDSCVAGHRHRRQHRDLQRRERAPAEASAISRSGPAGGAVAPVAGYQHPPGLAVARTVRRHPEREPLVPGDVDLAGTQRHADPRRRSPARRGAGHVVDPLSHARREAPLRTAAEAGRRQAGTGARRDPELSVLEARLQRGRECRRQGRHDQRRRRGRRGREESVRNRRRAAAGLPDERRDHADRRQHPPDGRLPAVAVRRGRRSASRRRELQPDGPAEAGRDDGAGESRRGGHRRPNPGQGQAGPQLHRSMSCRWSSRSSAM